MQSKERMGTFLIFLIVDPLPLVNMDANYVVVSYNVYSLSKSIF